MPRLALALLGVILVAVGAFPTEVPNPDGRTVYFGLRSSPLVYHERTEKNEVQADGTIVLTGNRVTSFQFVSWSFASAVVGLTLVVTAARRRQGASPPTSE